MFPPNMQSGPTAHKYLKFWAGSQKLREQRSCRCDLLKVIQHQQEVLLAKGAFELIEHRLPGAFSQTQGIGDGGSNEYGVAKSLQRDEADTSGKVLPKVSRHLERHSCFADAAGACEDEEAYLRAPQQRTDRCYLRLSANQRCKWYGEGIYV